MPVMLASATRASALKNMDRLPSLSPAVHRLLGLLARRDVEVNQLSKAISADPPMTGHLLATANSAYFNRGAQVKTVSQAIARVGLSKLRRIVLSKSLSRVFRSMRTDSSWSATRFQLHSVATGAAAELICDFLRVEGCENAFLGGLMHDVGKLLIACGQPEKFREIEDRVAVTGRAQAEFEVQLLGLEHAELSGMAVAAWELPFSLARAVAHHHHPEEPKDSNGVSLSQLLCAADRFTNSIGISIRETAHATEPTLPKFAGHSYPEQEFAKRFEEEWTTLSEFCF